MNSAHSSWASVCEQLSAYAQPRCGAPVADSPVIAELGAWDELDGRLGEAVLGALPGTRVGAGRQSGADEPLESVGEDVGRDALLGAGEQFAEVAAITEHHVAEHEQAPAIAERLDGHVDGASRTWVLAYMPLRPKLVAVYDQSS
jgi:hypothetical protein